MTRAHSHAGEVTPAAIRVLKRGKGERYAIHLLADASRTYCGLTPAELQVVAELGETDPIRETEACLQCRRIREHVSTSRSARSAEPAPRITAEPRPGRARATGPLYHGTVYRGRQGFLR